MRESGASPFGHAQPRGASSGILKHTPGKTPPVSSCPATQPSMGGARVAGWFGGGMSSVDTVWCQNRVCGLCGVPRVSAWTHLVAKWDGCKFHR